MNALNIMWLLNEVDHNTIVDIQYCRTKTEDCIYIETPTFKFSIGEYGNCVLYYNGNKDVQSCKDMYRNVSRWVKKYFSEIL